jgi:hypothetical protein
VLLLGLVEDGLLDLEDDVALASRLLDVPLDGGARLLVLGRRLTKMHLAGAGLDADLEKPLARSFSTVSGMAATRFSACRISLGMTTRHG